MQYWSFPIRNSSALDKISLTDWQGLMSQSSQDIFVSNAAKYNLIIPLSSK